MDEETTVWQRVQVETESKGVVQEFGIIEENTKQEVEPPVTSSQKMNIISSCE